MAAGKPDVGSRQKLHYIAVMTHVPSPLLVLPVAFVALATPALAQDAPTTYSTDLNVFEYGILCFYDDDALTNDPMPFPQVSATFAAGGLFDEVRVEKTLIVPGVSGMVVGVISSLEPGRSYDVVSTITHTNLSGVSRPDRLQLSFDTQVEIDSWQIERMSSDFYGTYRFLTQRGVETIYDVTLTVVPPSEYTGRYPECLTPP